jgi:hypothetical protein
MGPGISKKSGKVQILKLSEGLDIRHFGGYRSRIKNRRKSEFCNDVYRGLPVLSILSHQIASKFW